MSASLSAGAVTYALTSMAGQAATSAVQTTLGVGGWVATEASRWMLGDGVGARVGAAVASGSSIVGTVGSAMTHTGSMLLSASAAAAVGSCWLLGEAASDVWTRYGGTKNADAAAVETTDVDVATDFVVVSSGPITKPMLTSDETVSVGGTSRDLELAGEPSDPSRPPGDPKHDPELLHTPPTSPSSTSEVSSFSEPDHQLSK